jgi:hypothetical protein
MLRPLAYAFAAALLAGCASTPGTPDFAVAPGQYGAAFEAARDTLTSQRFLIDRVDAAAGVITTSPKATAGLATPWDEEQTTLDQEWEDLLNDQQRRIRITFEPAGAPPEGAGTDLRQVQAPITGHVEVVVDRTQHTGWRLETTGLRYSSITEDPALRRRAMWPSYVVPFSQDPLYAGRIADEIRKRLAGPDKEKGQKIEHPAPAKSAG